MLYYSINNPEDKGLHTFPRGICPKVKDWSSKLAYYYLSN